MGLHDNKCDSCGKKVDILFPIAILDNLPSGVSKLVQRWYCLVCKEVIEGEAESIEPDDEVKKMREYDCGCEYVLLMKDEIMDVWKLRFLCRKHSFEDDKSVIYSCGCMVKEISGNLYVYRVVCEKHV